MMDATIPTLRLLCLARQALILILIIRMLTNGCMVCRDFGDLVVIVSLSDGATGTTGNQNGTVVKSRGDKHYHYLNFSKN